MDEMQSGKGPCRVVRGCVRAAVPGALMPAAVASG